VENFQNEEYANNVFHFLSIQVEEVAVLGPVVAMEEVGVIVG
jgi:hypothetical protein